MNYHNSWTYLLGAGFHRLHLRDELVVVLLVPAEAPREGAQKRPEEWQDEQAHCKSPEEKAHPSSMYLSWYWAGWPSAARFLPIGVDSLPQQYLRSAAVTSVRQASCQQHSQQPVNHKNRCLRQASFQ